MVPSDPGKPATVLEEMPELGAEADAAAAKPQPVVEHELQEPACYSAVAKREPNEANEANAQIAAERKVCWNDDIDRWTRGGVD